MEFYRCHCDANPNPIIYSFTANGKVIYNYTGNQISRDRVFHGARNITCSASNGLPSGYDSIAVIHLPVMNESRRFARIIVGIVISVFYTLTGVLIFMRYRKQKTQEEGYTKTMIREV
ncbi:uncharacterized protein [Apostichopus japonicus]|uniref:uncharacterized protein n=1 Tax=Stichopus japonicus TaxID=307972 RepID=UPI003AB1F0AE